MIAKKREVLEILADKYLSGERLDTLDKSALFVLIKEYKQSNLYEKDNIGFKRSIDLIEINILEKEEQESNGQ